jgi:cyclopropane-fatty-acyl-phospholipid synthase
MDRWLRRIFARLIRKGTLRVSSAPGRSFEVGDGTGEPLEISFKNRFTLLSILANPELKLGECYMDGSFRVERGTIADLLDLVRSQAHDKPPLAIGLLINAYHYVIRRFVQFNPRGRAKRNVAHHSDLDGRLYSLFLDSDQQ